MLDSSFLFFWLDLCCVCSLEIPLRISSVQQAWECSSQLGPSSMWRRYMFSLRSATTGQNNPPLTCSSSSSPELRPTDTDTWGSWRVSLWSSAWGFQWCWPWGFMTTKKEASGWSVLLHNAWQKNWAPVILYCTKISVQVRKEKKKVPLKNAYLGVLRFQWNLLFSSAIVHQQNFPAGVKGCITNIYCPQLTRVSIQRKQKQWHFLPRPSGDMACSGVDFQSLDRFTAKTPKKYDKVVQKIKDLGPRVQVTF